MRRRNLVPEAVTALAPAGAWAAAELVRGRKRMRPKPPALPAAVPAFKTIDRWNPEIGGSKVGHIRVDYEDLVRAFGEPIPTPEGVNGEWWPEVNWYLEFEDGSKAMIYDWQVAGPIERNREWHVAGCSTTLGYIASILDLPPEQVEDGRILFS